MTLSEKIIALYPELTTEDFNPMEGTIVLQDNSDGKGAFIREWNHPTLAKPTDEELS